MSIKGRVLRLTQQIDKVKNKITFVLVEKSKLTPKMEKDEKVYYVYFDF